MTYKNEIPKIVKEEHRMLENLDPYLDLRKRSRSKEKETILFQTDLLQLNCSKKRYNELVNRIAKYHKNCIFASKENGFLYLQYYD